MSNKRGALVLLAAGLAVSIASFGLAPAQAQYQNSPYDQPSGSAPGYGGQNQYGQPTGQSEYYPQNTAPQQVPYQQAPQTNLNYGAGNQNYLQGNNPQQFYPQPAPSAQPYSQQGGYGQGYNGQAQSFGGANSQGQFPASNQQSPIYGYAADIQQQSAQAPNQYPQQGYVQQQPAYSGQMPAPALGYQPQAQQGQAVGLQQSAGAYFNGLDSGQQATPAANEEPAGNAGSGLGGKLAQGAKTLAGVAVPMATGYFMTQAANKQARRMGVPSGGIFGNQYGGMNPYGMNPYGNSPYGSSPFGSSPYGAPPAGGNMLLNGLGSLLGR